MFDLLNGAVLRIDNKTNNVSRLQGTYNFKEPPTIRLGSDNYKNRFFLLARKKLPVMYNYNKSDETFDMTEIGLKFEIGEYAKDLAMFGNDQLIAISNFGRLLMFHFMGGEPLHSVVVFEEADTSNYCGWFEELQDMIVSIKYNFIYVFSLLAKKKVQGLYLYYYNPNKNLFEYRYKRYVAENPLKHFDSHFLYTVQDYDEVIYSFENLFSIQDFCSYTLYNGEIIRLIRRRKRTHWDSPIVSIGASKTAIWIASSNGKLNVILIDRLV